MHYFARDAASSKRSASEENTSTPERQVLTQDGGDGVPVSSPGGAAAHETLDPVTSSSDSPSSSQSPRLSSALSFRKPNKNIKLLRQLALQGREETLREEAEGREKIVWDSVDPQVRREVGGGDRDGDGQCPGSALAGGTLSSGDNRASDVLEAGSVVVGVSVGDGKRDGEGNEGELVDSLTKRVV